MLAYQLLARLRHLTLTADNDAEYWDEKIQWIGTNSQWLQVNKEEQQYE